jgi:hypothetical protein
MSGGLSSLHEFVLASGARIVVTTELDIFRASGATSVTAASTAFAEAEADPLEPGAKPDVALASRDSFAMSDPPRDLQAGVAKTSVRTKWGKKRTGTD